MLAGCLLQPHTWIARAMSFEIVFNTLREREIYISISIYISTSFEGGSWRLKAAAARTLRSQAPEDAPYPPFWDEL